MLVCKSIYIFFILLTTGVSRILVRWSFTLYGTLDCQLLSLCYLRMLGIFSCFFAICFFFKINFSKKISGIPSECQTICIQIRTDVMSVLIWIQMVCKRYQETTLVGKELNVKCTDYGAILKDIKQFESDSKSICIPNLEFISR